jgi:hypothetical protein
MVEKLVLNYLAIQVNNAQMYTLIARMDKLEMTIHAKVAELKATIQSLTKQTPIHTLSYQFQGHLITNLE